MFCQNLYFYIKGVLEPLIICCCPEIISDEMITNPKKITELFALVASGKENFSATKSTLDEGANVFNELEQPPVAEKSLKLCRSCILLQFCVAIQLVFTEEKGSL